MIDNNPKPDLVPMQTIASTVTVARNFPELADTWGTFAWTHPTLGMAGGKNEYYAVEKNGVPARLLIMQPAADAKVAYAKSWKNGAKELSVPNFKGIDLVYHIRYDAEGKELWREWLVLNSEKITAFSANPNLIQKILEHEFVRMNKTFQRPNESEAHYPSARNKGLDALLERVIVDGPEGLPSSVMKDIPDLAPWQEEWLIENKNCAYFFHRLLKLFKTK